MSFQMSDELNIWLEDVDLEDYICELAKLGVEMVKHLQQIKKEHLEKMGMLELEIPRFIEKLSKHDLGLHQNEPQSSNVNIHMPSGSFGHTVTDIPEDKLIA